MALSARKGAIVIQRHNEIKFELQDLAARALISSVVRDEHQTDCILDVRITNLDAPSNIHRKPEAILLFHPIEREKIQTPAGILAKKAGKSYSETTNCMELMMSIAIVRAHIYASEDHDEPNEPITPGGRWGRPQPVHHYAFGGQQQDTSSQSGQKSRQVENCKN